MAITNYQFTAGPAHSIQAVCFGNNGTLLIRNLGPDTVYLGDGSASPPQVVSPTSGYPLLPGEQLEFSPSTQLTWLTFNTCPDPDELGRHPNAEIRVMTW